MGRYVDRRAGYVRMPSEVQDGRDGGAAAGPVITYRLSDEELAKYRGEEMMARMKRFDGRLPELFARFAAGAAETAAGKTKLAKEFEVSVGTIYHYYNRWKQQQAPAQEQKAEGPVEGGQAPAAETTPPEPAPAPDPAPGTVLPNTAAQSAEEVSSEPGHATEAPVPAADRPAEVSPGPISTSEVLPPAEQQASPQLEGRAESDGSSVAPDLRRVWPPNLCETCVKRDVCPVSDVVFSPAHEFDRSHLPGKLSAMRIIVSARYVQECSSYYAG